MTPFPKQHRGHQQLHQHRRSPLFRSAATNTDGSKVILTYNEPLSATTAAASAYTVTTAGSANAVTAVAISGSTVELTLANAVKNDQAVTVAYTDPPAPTTPTPFKTAKAMTLHH